MAWWYQTIGFALAAIFLLYRYFTRNFSYWRDLKVQYVKPMPFLGNCADLLFLRKSSGQFLESIYERGSGKPYVGFFIADKPALLVRSTNLICNILVKDFGYFADRFVDSNPHTDPLGTRNLFVIKGAEWRYLRNKLSPTFTSGKMKKMFYLVARCDQQMVDYLIGSVGKKGSVDMKEIAARCTTDVISNCAFGIDSNTLNDPTSEFRELGKKTFEYDIRRAIEVLSFFFVPYVVKITKFSFFQQQTNDFLRRVFWDTLTAREQTKNGFKRNDLIDHLIQLKNEGRIEGDDEEIELLDEDKNVASSFDFSGDDLVAQAAIFFAAGFETSASTMSFCLYEMATHPEMQQRLREEIADHLEATGGVITYEMVFGMQYLDMVIRVMLPHPVEELKQEKSLINNTEEIQLKWLGHIRRLSQDKNAKQVMEISIEGRRRKGRSRIKWEDTFDRMGMKRGKIILKMKKMCNDRKIWRGWTERGEPNAYWDIQGRNNKKKLKKI